MTQMKPLPPKNKPPHSRRGLVFFILLSLVFSACTAPAGSPVSDQTATAAQNTLPAATQTPQPIPTATDVPARNLVVCLEQEPESLYLYGSSSRSSASVLEAIYDGPFDVINSEGVPVILAKMPSPSDGDVTFTAVSVHDGDRVVDVDGNLTTLEAGLTVLPSGCTSLGCAVTWDGVSELQMDRQGVTFTLRPDISWSDGAPLSADDSVYSFQVAADDSTPISRQMVYRTSAYTALDDTHVQWSGVPGYFPERLDTVFWSPLPRHAWGSILPEDLLIDERSSRSPLGWGAYVIEEWVEGDHIRLKKNPNYFRLSEGLPAFDNLVFRFLGQEGDSLIAALQSKECDIIDQSSSLESQLSAVMDLEEQGLLQTYISQGPEWEQLVFGIKHISHDDGVAPWSDDRPDYFSDSRIRQAFAYCIDRDKIVAELLHGLSSVPATYLPASHPLVDEEAQVYPYDSARGVELLNAAGWLDWDGDPETPLQAAGVFNVMDGTFFRVNYYTTKAALRQQMAEIIRDSLAGCGIEVNVTQLEPEEMYAEGPDGILFGRNFDLAQFAWSAGVLPLCEFYIGSQIPTTENNWLTLNIGGYQNYAYDEACRASITVRPDQTEAYAGAQKAAQHLFAQELPVIPLYFRLKIALARPDLCGLNVENVSGSFFWNLEEINYGEGCEAR